MISGDAIDVGNVSESFVSVSSKLISGIGQIGLWLQAIGVIVILWLIFQIVMFFINRRRMQEIYTIKEDMKRIEGKIDYIADAVNISKRPLISKRLKIVDN